MLGFSLPKILLLFFILAIVWNFFRLFERKLKKNDNKESKNKNNNKNYEDEILVECKVCKSFVSKSFIENGKCQKCIEINENE